MREGFLKSYFSVYFIFITVDGFSSLLEDARAFEIVVLHRIGIFLKQVYAVDDLECGSRRIESLRDPVQQRSGFIVIEQVLPLFFNIVGIIVRFGDHREDPPCLDLRHNAS